MKTWFLVGGMLLGSLSFTLAQQEGGARRNWDPAQIAEREKKMVLDSLGDLTADQTQLIEFVYAQYGESLQTLMESRTEGGDRQVMMQQVLSIRQEKDKSMQDILNEEQMQAYRLLMKQIRERQQERRERRKNNPSDGGN